MNPALLFIPLLVLCAIERYFLSRIENDVDRERREDTWARMIGSIPNIFIVGIGFPLLMVLGAYAYLQPEPLIRTVGVLGAAFGIAALVESIYPRKVYALSGILFLTCACAVGCALAVSDVPVALYDEIALFSMMRPLAYFMSLLFVIEVLNEIIIFALASPFMSEGDELTQRSGYYLWLRDRLNSGFSWIATRFLSTPAGEWTTQQLWRLGAPIRREREAKRELRELRELRLAALPVRWTDKSLSAYRPGRYWIAMAGICVILLSYIVAMGAGFVFIARGQVSGVMLLSVSPVISALLLSNAISSERGNHDETIENFQASLQ